MNKNEKQSSNIMMFCSRYTGAPISGVDPQGKPRFYPVNQVSFVVGNTTKDYLRNNEAAYYRLTPDGMFHLAIQSSLAGASPQRSVSRMSAPLWGWAAPILENIDSFREGVYSSNLAGVRVAPKGEKVAIDPARAVASIVPMETEVYPQLVHIFSTQVEGTEEVKIPVKEFSALMKLGLGGIISPFEPGKVQRRSEEAKNFSTKFSRLLDAVANGDMTPESRCANLVAFGEALNAMGIDGDGHAALEAVDVIHEGVQGGGTEVTAWVRPSLSSGDGKIPMVTALTASPIWVAKGRMSPFLQKTNAKNALSSIDPYGLFKQRFGMKSLKKFFGGSGE